MKPDQRSATTPGVTTPAAASAAEGEPAPGFGDWLRTTGLGLLVLLALSLIGWWLWRDWGFLVWLSSDRIFCL